MKRVDINALRGITNMSDSEIQRKLGEALQQTGNSQMAGKINASAISQLKQQLASMDQSQLDSLVSQMQNMDSGMMQKLKGMLGK